MGKIDTSEWKEFKLGYIMVGNKKQGHGLFEIVNSVAYHGKDVTETDSDDGINYITRSKFNNGLKANGMLSIVHFYSTRFAHFDNKKCCLSCG